MNIDLQKSNHKWDDKNQFKQRYILFRFLCCNS